MFLIPVIPHCFKSFAFKDLLNKHANKSLFILNLRVCKCCTLFSPKQCKDKTRQENHKRFGFIW